MIVLELMIVIMIESSNEKISSLKNQPFSSLHLAVMSPSTGILQKQQIKTQRQQRQPK